MRRLIIGLLLVFLAVACTAQVTEIHYINTATVLWDAVTEDTGGTPFPPEFIVSYEVYLYNSQLVIDDQIPANVTLMGTATAATFELDLAGYPFALYWVGVRYVVDNGQGTTTYSTIGWSYDPVSTDPTGPFGYLHVEATFFLPILTGLKDSGM